MRDSGMWRVAANISAGEGPFRLSSAGVASMRFATSRNSSEIKKKKKRIKTVLFTLHIHEPFTFIVHGVTEQIVVAEDAPIVRPYHPVPIGQLVQVGRKVRHRKGIAGELFQRVHLQPPAGEGAGHLHIDHAAPRADNAQRNGRRCGWATASTVLVRFPAG